MTWKQMKRAWRKAEKKRMMTLTQLTGLAGGLACCILIYLWVADERQFDHFGRNDDRLFQVLENYPGAKEVQTTEQTPALLANALATAMPEIEYSVSVVPVSTADRLATVSVGETEVDVEARYTSRDFFKVFAYPLMEGDPGKLLADGRQVVLSKTLASKLFHQTSGLIGKTVTCNQHDMTGTFIISGVFDNSAVRSSSPVDLLLSYDLFVAKDLKAADWKNGDAQTFIMLKPGIPVAGFNSKLANFLSQKNPELKATLFAQNYRDKYLHNHYKNGKPAGGRIEYVTLFSVVAFVILFIACINFLNLATAFANERMKDVGAVPARGRRSIAWHFLAESAIMCAAALLAALLLVFLCLPAFNAFTGKQLSLQPDAKLVVIIGLVTLVTGVASGAYPAMYLSGLHPLTAIRGRLKQTGKTPQTFMAHR